jgi:adenylate kinase family enzyme
MTLDFCQKPVYSVHKKRSVEKLTADYVEWSSQSVVAKRHSLRHKKKRPIREVLGRHKFLFTVTAPCKIERAWTGSINSALLFALTDRTRTQ